MLPLSKVQYNLSRRYPLDVIGTANISYGHKLREPETRHIAKYHGSRSIFEGANGQLKEEREREQIIKTLEFEKETNRKIKNKHFRQRVQQGIDEKKELN